MLGISEKKLHSKVTNHTNKQMLIKHTLHQPAPFEHTSSRTDRLLYFLFSSEPLIIYQATSYYRLIFAPFPPPPPPLPLLFPRGFCGTTV